MDTDDKPCRTLRTADDVTQSVLNVVMEAYEGWVQDDERIDWETLLDRAVGYSEYTDDPFDIDQVDNAAVRKIKKFIYDYRKGE